MKSTRFILWSVVLLLVLFCWPLIGHAEQSTAITKLNAQTIIVSDVLLEPGESIRIRPEFEPIGADERVSYTSNKKAVAKVSSSGVVKALKLGKATITVKAKKGKAKAKLLVTVAYRDEGANYFFYGVGNSNYERPEDRLPGCINDVNWLANAFKAARFTGRAFQTIDVRTDQTRLQMYAQLVSIATNPNITEKDTTIFYYSGHGYGTETPGNPYSGALVGVDGSGLTVEEVRRALDLVPGRVVVILDSCFSGQFIKSKNTKSPEEQARAFEQGVLNAFASGASQEKALTDSPVASKYKIITACRPLEYSYSIGRDSSQYGLFTRYVIAAIGAKRPSDTNKDKRVTLNELYKYVNKKVKAQIANINRNKAKKDRIQQRVMVWPTSDKSFVFAMD